MLTRLLSVAVLLAALWPFAPAASAQTPFWQTSSAAPYGPKVGLLATGDSTLLTAVEAGVLRTPNRGRSWSLPLRTRHARVLLATPGGQILVGGLGKVYRSADAGASWDSVVLATNYPVISAVATRQGGLLVGTGSTAQPGFLGDGVFYSADNGQTWTARNTGFGAALYVSHLLVDRTGRLYAGATDDAGWRQSGLLISDNEGQSWQHLPVRINGGGSIPNDVGVHEIMTMSLSPEDTLLFHVTGVAGRGAVMLNLRKPLTAVAAPATDWRVWVPTADPMWWYQALVERVYFARNGDWYASVSGSINTGGSLRSQDRGRSWQLIKSGLGLSAGARREAQTYAEMPDGKLFMVQDYDARVYWAASSGVTSGKPRRAAPTAVQLFPNPATDQVQLTSPDAPVQAAELLDLHGRRVRTFPVPAGRPTLLLRLGDVAAGVYLLRATLADGRVAQQRLVKQP